MNRQKHGINISTKYRITKQIRWESYIIPIISAGLRKQDATFWMGVGFADLEKQGIISPILSVEADYLRMVYYGDTVSIDAYIKEYNGIKLTVGYEVKDDRTGMVHCRGTSKHCFIDKTGRPLVLRKSFPELNEAFEAGVKIHKENKKALIKKREDK